MPGSIALQTSFICVIPRTHQTSAEHRKLNTNPHALTLTHTHALGLCPCAEPGTLVSWLSKRSKVPWYAPEGDYHYTYRAVEKRTQPLFCIEVTGATLLSTLNPTT
eukprot:1262694-Pyramimonas_sp.AAC.1